MDTNYINTVDFSTFSPLYIVLAQFNYFLLGIIIMNVLYKKNLKDFFVT